jgi:simple sugar transport system ATP-binding protein
VLRRGKVIDTVSTEGATEDGLARLMVGRDVLLHVEKGAARPGDVVLHVDGLEVVDDRGLPKVRGVGFDVRGGEIVAIAGVDGNGQSELIDAISGLLRPSAGRVEIAGTDVTAASAHDHYHAGLGHIPEDRQRRGLVLDFSIAENVGVHDYRVAPFSKSGWLYPRRMVDKAATLIGEFDVRGGGPATPASALSGGNQQKVILAREIDRDPKLLIAAQPTRGLDVGAIEYVHRRLVAERDEGRAVLLVSLELEEILSLADRILVMFEGRMVGEFPPTVTQEELGVAMIGGSTRSAA